MHISTQFALLKWVKSLKSSGSHEEATGPLSWNCGGFCSPESVWKSGPAEPTGLLRILGRRGQTLLLQSPSRSPLLQQLGSLLGPSQVTAQELKNSCAQETIPDFLIAVFFAINAKSSRVKLQK